MLFHYQFMPILGSNLFLSAKAGFVERNADEKLLPCFLSLSSAVFPESGHCWFDVNDARVSCIREKDIQNQFAGKESAYMLFYRRKDLIVSRNNPCKSFWSVSLKLQRRPIENILTLCPKNVRKRLKHPCYDNLLKDWKIRNNND